MSVQCNLPPFANAMLVDRSKFRGFREDDFLRISSCRYSARSPHLPEPCLWKDQNFANKF